MSAHSQRLPDFVIIGAAKAGTTSLYALLEQHPAIFMSAQKETEFFARDDQYAKGLESYAAHFADATPDQIVGEASTIYSMAPLFPDTAARMHDAIPQAKIIYMLREPVSRAFSFYVQLVKNYQNATRDVAIHRSFEEMILPEAHAKAAPREKFLSRIVDHFPDTTELCLVGSDYVQQIACYQAHYPPEQCLFLKFEDFVRDRQSVVRQITDFLGVGPLHETVFADASTTQNVSATHFDGLAAQESVAKMRDQAGPLWALRKLLPKGVRQALRARAVEARPVDITAARPASMQPETRAMLEARFAAQIPDLERLTGLSFEDWGLPEPHAR